MQESLYEISKSLDEADGHEIPTKTVLSDFEEFFAKNYLNTNEQKILDESVSHCLRKIAGDSWLLPRAIDSWLTKIGNEKLQNTFIHWVSVTFIGHPKILDFNLSIFDEENAVLAGYRLCGRSAPPVISLSWIIALYQYFPDSAYAKKHAAFLANYISTEYPHTTLDLLENDESPLAKSPLALELISILQDIQKKIAVLPDLLELAPTAEMLMVLSSLRRNESREINQKSEEKSLLASIFPIRRFKYSHRTAVTIHHGDTSSEMTFPMGKISLSIETPMTGNADPQQDWANRNGLARGPK